MTFLPGEVHLADVFPGGMRPVVVVSREPLNRGATLLCVPTTTSRLAERRRYRNYVFLPAGAGGLREDSLAVTHLVQPVDTSLLRERWGTLPVPLLEAVLFGVAWSIGIGR